MGYIANRALDIVKEEGLAGLVVKVYRKIMARPIEIVRSLYYAVCVKMHRRNRDPHALASFIFKGYGGFIRPLQSEPEIARFTSLADKARFHAVLEIGTATGGTLFLLSSLASDDATIISIDLPGGKFGGGYPVWRMPLYSSFGHAGQEIHLVRADSHDPGTVHRVERLLSGKGLDLLFIDGDHTYEGVKKDFDLYSPFVSKGGMIVLHDIVMHPPESGCDVHSFWESVKTRYRYEELIADKYQKAFGIGILYVD